MKQRETGENQTQRHSLWRSVLTGILPVFALALAVSFVLLCVAYGGVRPSVTIELGEDSPEVDAFLRKDFSDAEYLSAPEAHYTSAGNYPVRVYADGRTVPAVLKVRDTQPPAAAGIDTTVPAGKALSPDRLIRNLRDGSVVKVTYESRPDFDAVGDYEAVILLEDASGNSSRVFSTVHVRTVRDEVIAEAGGPAPDADAFLVGAYADITLSPITDAMLREPGEYPIRITTDGIEAESRLIVRDTVPPQGEGVTFIAAPGEQIRPEQLVTGIVDETEVTASFLSEPDPDSLDSQTVGVVLTDRGGNETTVYATLLFTNVKPVEIEARTAQLDISELLEEGTYTEASLDPFIPDDPGLHVLAVTIDGKRNLALVEVRDTTPPEIKTVNAKRYLNTPVDAAALVSVTDPTETEISFVSEPDWTKEKQEVTVAATDSSGNRSEKTFTLKLVADTEPPHLYGVNDRYCYTGEPVAYFAEVYAWDECDGEVDVQVDASKVNSEKSGDYPVFYTATDKAGNTARKTVFFRFVTPQVDEQRAQEVADKYIAKILTDDMTLAEQIEAIYNYIFKNLRYSARSNKWDWRGEAVRGLTTGRGDCFTAYAAARLLLEQTDAQVVAVQRMSETSHHYWMFVNIGTGWYHFDACNAWSGKKRCFMWTDAQTRRISKSYWRYDKTLYPPVATEPYNGGNGS
ncbi:MAG: transglutaminase family protein [Clostridia bacterium]|nr:transglutaminase family protein [Clostridia bacterium]